MNYREYGADNARTVLLLHGGGLSWWNYRGEAALLEGDFHVILPILDGHAGSDRDFTTLADNAAEIVDFIDARLGGRVDLIGGLSLGGQVLLEMLARRGDICRHALIESACVVPSRLSARMIAPALDCSYGLIKHEWFSRLQFRALGIGAALFDDYFRDSRAITKRNMAAFLRASSEYALSDGLRAAAARAHVFVGGREDPRMQVSARLIRDALPACELEVLPGWTHGAFSLNHAEAYAARVMEILR